MYRKMLEMDGVRTFERLNGKAIPLKISAEAIEKNKNRKDVMSSKEAVAMN